MQENIRLNNKHVTRRQHYVPRSYLCGFASLDPCDKKCMWTYDKTTSLPRLQPPFNSAVERDIYSLTDIEVNSPDFLETDVFTPVENDALPILDRLRLGEYEVMESTEDFMKIVLFLTLQHLRVPKSIKQTQEIADYSLMKCLKLFGTDLKDVKAPDSSNIHPKDPIKDAQLLELMKSPEKYLTITAKKDFVLGFTLDQFKEIGRQLVMLNWSLCTIPENYFFVTGDAPVVVFSPSGPSKFKFGCGFASPQVQVHFPLSPKYCLFGSRIKTPIKHRLAKPEVDELNQRCVYSAERFVFSAFKSNRIERLVNKSKTFCKSERIDKKALDELLKKHISKLRE